jgi:ribulose-phosphate 3-epimerase
MNQKSEYILSIHQETISDWKYFTGLKKRYNISIGIAVKPETSLKELKPYIKDIDHILIMTVNPGFSGQQFLESSWQKIDDAYAMCFEYNQHCVVAVDGGIKEQHIEQLKLKKVEMVAAASAIFEKSKLMRNNESLSMPHSSYVEQYIQQCIENIQRLQNDNR